MVKWTDYLVTEKFPLSTSWGMTPVVNLIESKPDVGPSIRRMRSRTGLNRLSATIDMAIDDYKSIFVPFIKGTLNGGMDWFLFVDITTGIEYQTRLSYSGNSFYSVKRKDDHHFKVNLTFELLEVGAVG